jgi:hypothetical protein
VNIGHFLLRLNIKVDYRWIKVYVKLREKYLLFIFAFPGIRGVKEASLASSKLTGISFRMSPAAPADEFVEIMI